MDIFEQVEQKPIDTYFFLIYYSNPMRSTVSVHIDGDENKILMKHDKFLDLIKATVGPEMLGHVSVTLTTYGTWYVLDRDNKRIQQLSHKKGENLINRQAELNKIHNNKPHLSLEQVIGNLATGGVDPSMEDNTALPNVRF